MIRLHFVVEGQTEETFVRDVLGLHLAAFGIIADCHRITLRRQGATTNRGGHVRYAHLRKDLDLWMKQDRHAESWFTTMVDLYALPDDTPGFVATKSIPTPLLRVQELEGAIAADLAHARFIPYVQLHEFEALLLAELDALEPSFPGEAAAIAALRDEVATFPTPEHVDDGVQTAPSKRIINHLPDYAGRKASAGPATAARIGLATLRERCPHFDHWLARLEHLGDR